MFLIVIGTVFVVAATGGLGDDAPRSSARSTQGEGHRALALLLEANGYRTRVWDEPPGRLTGTGVQVLFSVPVDLFADGAKDAAESTRRDSDTTHYLRFVREGGTLLLVGPNDFVEWLTSDLQLAAAEELRWDVRKRSTRREALFDLEAEGDWDAELQLRLSRQANHALEPLEASSSWEVLATDRRRNRGPRLVRLPVQRGAIAVLAGADLFRNDRVSERDNGLYFLRALEALGVGPGGPAIAFDDYAEGGWSPASPLALAMGPSVRLVTLHLLALALTFLWAAGWVGPFARPRDDRNRKAVAPAARARGVANLYVKAERWDLLARLLQRGTLRALVPGARLERFRRVRHGHEGGDDDPQGTALGPSEEATDQVLLDTYLRPVFVARRGEAEWPSVRDDLSRRVRSEDELARLDRDLQRLRAELATPTRTDDVRARGPYSPSPDRASRARHAPHS